MQNTPAVAETPKSSTAKGTQGAQEDAPALLCNPAAQLAQVAAPGKEAEPMAQGAHVKAPVAPMAELKVPAAHARQEEGGAANVPAGQEAAVKAQVGAPALL